MRLNDSDWDNSKGVFPVEFCTAEEYLALDTNERVEFVDGRLELVPLQDLAHESVAKFLFLQLHRFVEKQSCVEVFYSGVRVLTVENRYRVPDVMMFARAKLRPSDEFCVGAELVMEVTHSENRSLDLVTKRREYALAGIKEYWIVDRQNQEISVLELKGSKYAEYGNFKVGSSADSVLLKGFSVDVSAALVGEIN